MLKRVIAVLLTVLTVLSVVSCAGIGDETEHSTEIQTDAGILSDLPTVEQADGYRKVYSDFYAMNEWYSENIQNTDCPPVCFKLGDISSRELNWTKTVGDKVTEIDYKESDTPVERYYRDITYTCAEKNLVLTLRLTTYPGYPILEYDTHIQNTATENSEVITEFNSINCALTDYTGSVLHYNRGSLGYDAEEYRPYTHKFERLNKISLEIENGMPTTTYLPYFNVENVGNESGVISAVNWQGGWRADFELKDNKIILSAGQNYFGSVILPEESFKFPGIVLLFYKNGDWQEGQNIWRRWIIEHNLMRYTEQRDYTQNVYCCSEFNGTTRDLGAVEKIVESGIQNLYNCVFEFDAGWYNYYSSNWGFTGDWSPNAIYGENGIKKISDYCHQNGIKFAMWLEPERYYSLTPQANEIGNQTIFLNGGGMFMDGDGKYITNNECKKNKYSAQGLVNYGEEKVQDYIFNLITSCVEKYGMDVYRQDFNTENQMYWSAYDEVITRSVGAPRTGATENHACEGFAKTWQRILEYNKDLVIDCCAGGGRRNDLESVRCSFIHTKSDYNGDVVSQQCQNFGAYSWYIFTGTGLYSPNDKYDTRSRLTLSIGFANNGFNKATEKGLQEWSSMIKYLYNDYYQLSDYSLSTTDSIALQFNDYENKEGMAVIYFRSSGNRLIKLKGLDADTVYSVWSKDDESTVVEMTGNELMTNGYEANSNRKSNYAYVLMYKAKG